MARTTDIVGSVANMVNPVNKHAMTDGHQNNQSYKMPMPKLAGTKMGSSGNSSYMHPHAQPLNFEKPWQSVDKTLQEAERHPSQLSLSKTVFPVATDKVRGAPRPVRPLQAAKQPPPKII